MAFDVPVALFLFKRKESALRVVDRVRDAAPSRVYLLSDNGRNAAERAKVAEVRAAIEAAIDWPCEVIKNYADKNIGVYENIALGARWVFEREPRAIFLEDDNLPEPTFFEFCSELLEEYANDTRILWVCGTNYLGRYETPDGSSYVFTKHLLPCGWASWADKFLRFYDFDLRLIDSPGLVSRVAAEYPDRRLYRQQISDVLAEKRRKGGGQRYHSWDYHMGWSLRAEGLYGISPAVNQIQNIGADEDAIHGGTSLDQEMTRRFVGMSSHPLSMPLRHPDVVLPDLKYERIVSSIILFPLRERIRGTIRRTIGKVFQISSETSITGTIKRWIVEIAHGRN